MQFHSICNFIVYAILHAILQYMQFHSISRGAQRVLYAFRGALSFMIVFGQFECAESKKIGHIICPSSENAEKWHINGVKWHVSYLSF